MPPTATGTLRGTDQIAISRTFDTSVEDVWEAVTDPERLSRWYGTWTGDCASGRVTVVMMAEGDHAGTPVDIVRCERPHRLDLHLEEAGLVWNLGLEIVEAGGHTRLTLVQRFDRADGIDSVGPGWEYYLDRLVAAESGGDVEAITWDPDYFPGLQPHYESLAQQMTFT